VLKADLGAIRTPEKLSRRVFAAGKTTTDLQTE
jgi:hypothetical protein